LSECGSARRADLERVQQPSGQLHILPDPLWRWSKTFGLGRMLRPKKAFTNVVLDCINNRRADFVQQKCVRLIPVHPWRLRTKVHNYISNAAFGLSRLWD
jgi:hypothetical protein